jgi:hypothetical protein
VELAKIDPVAYFGTGGTYLWSAFFILQYFSVMFSCPQTQKKVK